jgi:glycosyltransferase involved in cell wall biosynthesis
VPDASIIRILYVHHRSEPGGAPTSLSFVISNLDRERFEPHVLCPPGRAAELFRAAGATVHEGTVAGFTHIWASTYHGRRWLLLARELVRLPMHIAQLHRLLRTRFDLVHLNDSPMIPAAWLARRERIPVVWHLRSAPPAGGRDRRSRLVRRALLRLAAARIAINGDVAQLWDVPADVIPNAVALDRFRPGDAARAREALGLAADRPVVSYFGFVYPYKGFREFILIAASLTHERGVDATFLVVGGGVRSSAFFRSPFGRTLELLGLAHDYEAEARELVRTSGLENRFRFVPFTPDTAELYRASAAVIAPSQGPEIGRPVLEGAASGVAVITTGTTTGGGIVKPGRTALIVENVGADELAAATAELLEDPERRAAIGAAAYKHALRSFDPVANTRRVEEVYDRVLGARPPATSAYADRTASVTPSHEQ